jgi:hypothetical protein
MALLTFKAVRETFIRATVARQLVTIDQIVAHHIGGICARSRRLIRTSAIGRDIIVAPGAPVFLAGI